MATSQESAIFSLYAYASSTANRPDLPSAQWVIEENRTEGTQGFAYAVFRNTNTNEMEESGSDPNYHDAKPSLASKWPDSPV